MGQNFSEATSQASDRAEIACKADLHTNTCLLSSRCATHGSCRVIGERKRVMVHLLGEIARETAQAVSERCVSLSIHDAFDRKPDGFGRSYQDGELLGSCQASIQQIPT